MKFNLTGRFIFCMNKEIQLIDYIQIFRNFLVCVSADRRIECGRSSAGQGSAGQGRAGQRSAAQCV